MKLGPVVKLDKANKATSKKLTMTSCQQIMTSLSFFWFMVNLEVSGRQIPDAWSVKLTFSLTVTFSFTKTENRTKKFLTQLSHYSFEWRYDFGIILDYPLIISEPSLWLTYYIYIKVCQHPPIIPIFGLLLPPYL